jgi:AraC family transcriptional regulator of arabinose operon
MKGGRPIILKRHGFPGQHHLIVPQEVVRVGRRHPLLATLLPTAAGYFPHAAGHYVVRPEGVPEVIIILCLSGRGWVEVDGARQSMGEGETVFIPAQVAHAYGAENDDPWSIVWAHAQGNDLAVFMRELGIGSRRRKLRLPADALERLGFHRVYQLMEEGYSLPLLIASSSALRLVLGEMLRAKLAPRAPQGTDPDPLQRATEWMRQNIGARVTLSQLAHEAGASVSYLSALFRSKAGYPPMDYFSRLKIRQACRLLDTTTSRVKVIGAEIGYPDPYYFSRLFRHIMGMSPRAYRAVPKG